MTGSHFRGFVLWPQWTKRVQGPLPDRIPVATKGWLLSQIHLKWEWELAVLPAHFSQREVRDRDVGQHRLRRAPGQVRGSCGPGVGEGGQVDLQAGSLFAPPDP